MLRQVAILQTVRIPKNEEKNYTTPEDWFLLIIAERSMCLH